jgi:hypothetical protein
MWQAASSGQKLILYGINNKPSMRGFRNTEFQIVKEGNPKNPLSNEHCTPKINQQAALIMYFKFNKFRNQSQEKS